MEILIVKLKMYPVYIYMYSSVGVTFDLTGYVQSDYGCTVLFKGERLECQIINRFLGAGKSTYLNMIVII